jgi:hypothetical protein
MSDGGNVMSDGEKVAIVDDAPREEVVGGDVIRTISASSVVVITENDVG